MKPFSFWYYDNNGKWLLENINESYHEIPAHNKGDVMIRMCKYALRTGDKDVIKACIELFNAGKRWPDSLNNEGDCKNRLQYWWGRQKFFHFGAKTHKYGPQKNVSRDCGVMLITAAYWHLPEMIKDIRIPWKIQRPSLWHWKKFLETGKEIHRVKYEYWEKFNIDLAIAFSFKGYVKSLCSIKAFIARSYEIKTYLLPYIPWWNLLNRLLCNDQAITKDQVESYIPQKGYLWSADDLPEEEQPLGPDEPVYLDKAMLEFAYENKNF